MTCTCMWSLEVDSHCGFNVTKFELTVIKFEYNILHVTCNICSYVHEKNISGGARQAI